MLKKFWIISTIILILCIVVNMLPFNCNVDPMSNGENFVNRAIITFGTFFMGVISDGIWLVCLVCAIFSYIKRLLKSCDKAQNSPAEK